VAPQDRGEGDAHGEDRRGREPPPPAVEHLAQEETHHDQHDDPEERGRLRVEHAGHDADEGAPDQEQVEEDEDE